DAPIGHPPPHSFPTRRSSDLIHPKHGTLGDYVEVMNAAEALGLRVIVDLVVNHTSIDHPWFQSAREDEHSQFRDWDGWAEQRPKDRKSTRLNSSHVARSYADS